MIEIKVKERAMVKPASKTPRRSIWMSGLDLMNNVVHMPSIYLFRHNGASNFFDPAILKEALSKALVPYYPIAGRLRRDNSGRLEIDCNGEGVLFVEAETDSVLDDLGDFAPTPEVQKLTPLVDYSNGVSSYPLLVTQVTYFKCGGVSLSFAGEHRVMDGPAAFDLVKAWANNARGLELPSTLPFFDRTILSPRNLPQILFDHFEYQLTPSMKSSLQNSNAKHGNADESTKFSVFKITKEQLNILKAKAKQNGNTTNYSTYEILAGHLWKCACKARGLVSNNQETRLYFPANGRFLRMEPPVPPGYFGCVVFMAMATAEASDLQSKPLWYAASRIRETRVRMDSDYLRSAIDYLELHPDTKRFGNHLHRSPNFGVTSWMKLPIHEADFGWGRPFYMGPGGNMHDGKTYVIPSATEDGNLLVVIALQPEEMKLFEKFFYSEFDETKASEELILS
ncbi:Transferase [Trema orientale]|uniref:Transferase n=1 Tax=Trema orientale TaxID=63057 RepID=A0A2P5EL89_TREOI|nr:Transferase [Trema orientale]